MFPKFYQVIFVRGYSYRANCGVITESSLTNMKLVVNNLHTANMIRLSIGGNYFAIPKDVIRNSHFEIRRIGLIRGLWRLWRHQ